MGDTLLKSVAPNLFCAPIIAANRQKRNPINKFEIQ